MFVCCGTSKFSPLIPIYREAPGLCTYRWFSSEVAQVQVGTPYYSGDLEVLCMKSPVYDLVIGNIQGARDPWSPDLSWNEPTAEHNIADTKVPVTSNSKTEEQAQGVQTRAMKVKAEAPTSQLKVPPSIGVSQSEFLEAQKQDESISHLWEKARSEDNVSQSKGKYTFYIKHGCLKRRKNNDIADHLSQIVVPKSLRHDIMRVAHDSIMAQVQERRISRYRKDVCKDIITILLA